MNTLLIRLAGPMQSWGVESRFGVRDAGREPSKSGVIGLICAALGRPRSAPVDDLAALRMGVRVDREGSIGRDYHIAQNVYKSGGGLKTSDPSSRYYLADASFLVGLEAEDFDFLRRLHQALRDPVWMLYLGRKAFIPGEPLWLENGLLEGLGLLEALKSYRPAPAGPVRLVLEDPLGSQARSDVPISFAERRFSSRRVSTTYFTPQTSPQEAA
jgi:CRISPR system Cascade subunit CasD